jgi:RNA polymerase sigma factor (sigma-70 family)
MQPNDHLFRREAGHLVATLTRLFGVHNLALAEDVVQDAFCRALEVWNTRGVPENPRAWLLATAKNRALDILRRQRTAQAFAPELGRLLESEWTVAPVVDELFAADAVQDGQLRMMFSCCHPRLSEAAQVALILNILCGFTIDEIAGAFVSTHSAIEKRITRAKNALKRSKRLFDTAVPADFADRLPGVHRALYLLFNEGYHGASPHSAIRVELCREAMRLAAALLHHASGAVPATYALCALMALHAARLPARLDATGNLLSLVEQDRSRWDRELTVEGLKLLALSAKGVEVSEYHLEAAIASIHALAERAEDTDWREIVFLYDSLITIKPSPVVALSRAIAIAECEGPARGLQEIERMEGRDRMAAYPFYSAALAELERRSGNYRAARQQFQAALNLARNPMERQYLRRRLQSCQESMIEPSGTDKEFWEGALDRLGHYVSEPG